MGKAEKDSLRLGKLRWLWFVPALIMFFVSRMAFGTTAAAILAAAFGIGYFKICTGAKKKVICDEIISDMKESLGKAGFENTVFEIKSMSIGLVVRVYLIRARSRAEIYSRIISERIESGWYKKHIWVTQVVDVEKSESIEEARRVLNEVLLEDIREKAGGKGKE